MNRAALIESLKKYQPEAECEQPFIPKFLELLIHPDAFQRYHLPGHITGSAWIIDSSGDFVLLTHHAKLNKWLQPGGHADGEENVINVARREAEEETGLKDLSLLRTDIFDVDIHTIPARKDFPEHFHYDIRFLFRGNKEETLTVTDESHALEWVNVKQLSHLTHDNISMLRMAMKAKVSTL